MLKRPRAPSPPSSSSSVPLLDDEHASYQPKRRRILPPSLDGQSRRSESMFATDNDDGEEEYDQDDTMTYPDSHQLPPVASSSHNTEYESANTFLHELHASHRHRLIFSPSWHPSSPYEGKAYASPMQLPLHPEAPEKTGVGGMAGFAHGLPFEEEKCVKDRYEDTNKRLGSFFLTRRKQLDQDNNS
ncbi:hypothetical protein FB45DRAFT_916340 [Roridomyces roridus]|uniref:Uncharacterized protein n=1 Tax=Roridomyces roridus TaxID=1738132 RepID=A0AAD7BTZ6_9AGAR|nr:hypothetical protein FB45DRAFT_916340 [Roridomyces roridus]